MPHIAISGELGSGKSAVAGALSAALGAEVVSTGAIHRAIAASRGESALETNLAAESDEEIDRRIDGELVRRGEQADPIVFDSRMAWHFVPGAFRVHLVVDPQVGADRMHGRSPTDVERYESVAEATARAEERHASEHRRFLDKYGVDIDRLRNYDLVVDTTEATIDEVATCVLDAVAAGVDAPPRVCLSPRRLLPPPTGTPDGADDAPPAVAYRRPHFVLLAGADRVARALADGVHLLPVTLAAEGDEGGFEGGGAAS